MPFTIRFKSKSNGREMIVSMDTAEEARDFAYLIWAPTAEEEETAEEEAPPEEEETAEEEAPPEEEAIVSFTSRVAQALHFMDSAGTDCVRFSTVVRQVGLFSASRFARRLRDELGATFDEIFRFGWHHDANQNFDNANLTKRPEALRAFIARHATALSVAMGEQAL